ncbi:hypothetical protein CANMA_002404 [Candida margitis]|uniref:uncharacterized protein n=1 Tax=Candida margitis TaxID=1775924 RepID=UPI002227CCAF|nr:uncharacterized protein CANMA_002404 [Candida margitis]KAI5968188.1 hypothetical protein CANMA_002404 [Candida margitis]
MDHSPPNPEMLPYRRDIDILTPAFEQAWNSTIHDTPNISAQDLLKLAQNLIEMQSSDRDPPQPDEAKSLLSSPLVRTRITEKCKDKTTLSKSETWEILCQLPQDKSESGMGYLKACSSHEEIISRSPESLPDITGGTISNDDLDGEADSDETSSLMELQYREPSSPLHPPILSTSPYDDVVGLCLLESHLNESKDIVIDFKTQQTLRQVINEVAQLHLQVDKAFSRVADKLDKLESNSRRALQRLEILHHGSDFMNSRVNHMQTEVKMIKESGKSTTKVKRVVSFSDSCEVIPMSDKLPPVKTLSGLSLRSALHQQRGAFHNSPVELSPKLHPKRCGVPISNAPALKANTSVVTPTAFDLDSDDDASEVLINDDMEPYRISREGSWQHLPTQYAHPHSPASPYYEEQQDYSSQEGETSITPSQTPVDKTDDTIDEPVKIQYILLILLLYFYNKLHNFCRSKLS